MYDSVFSLLSLYCKFRCKDHTLVLTMICLDDCE